MLKRIYLLTIIVLSICLLDHTRSFAESFSNTISRKHLSGNFRQDTLHFIRHYIETGTFMEPYPWMNHLTSIGPWSSTITLYLNGIKLSIGSGADRHINKAIEKALRDTLNSINLDPVMADTLICHIALHAKKIPPIYIIESKGKAFELLGNIIPVRSLNKKQIYTHIQLGKEYLLRVMDPRIHGFYKKHDVVHDNFDKKIRTIYSASSLLTLLKISALDQDSRILDNIPKIAQFLMNMQVREGKFKGAFYYSLDADTRIKEQRFVTGTASKSIFTLLSMYQYNQNPIYLQSAIDAGKWLLSMQDSDGSITPEVYYKDGAWIYIHKFSFLYSGQALSALSRLYKATSDPIYFNGAKKIANTMIDKARQQDYFVRDHYRQANPVSTSWLIMSLLDYHKISHDHNARAVIIKTASTLLKKQCLNPNDIINYGRFIGTKATSGNGWINEVLGEYYDFCKKYNKDTCLKYKTAILLLTRWLIQNTYSASNTFFLQNADTAIGGLIRRPNENSIRTDAVCHGINGYTAMFNEWDNGILIDIRDHDSD